MGWILIAAVIYVGCKVLDIMTDRYTLCKTPVEEAAFTERVINANNKGV